MYLRVLARYDESRRVENIALTSSLVTASVLQPLKNVLFVGFLNKLSISRLDCICCVEFINRWEMRDK